MSSTSNKKVVKRGANYTPSAPRKGTGEKLVYRDAKTGRVIPIKVVKFGNVEVHGIKPSPDTVRGSVIFSTKALKGIEKKLAKPGVTIREKKGVPLYSLSSEDPTVMIQKLNGRTTQGRFIDGKFKETP